MILINTITTCITGKDDIINFEIRCRGWRLLDHMFRMNTYRHTKIGLWWTPADIQQDKAKEEDQRAHEEEQ